jgi:hypothetical protein
MLASKDTNYSREWTATPQGSDDPARLIFSLVVGVPVPRDASRNSAQANWIYHTMEPGLERSVADRIDTVHPKLVRSSTHCTRNIDGDLATSFSTACR